MSDPAAVFVLLLSHNHVRFVGEAIASVLGQTWTDWHLLVVDNCSTDGSWERIQDWVGKDSRITARRPAQRLTIAAALNLGLEAASGTFIAPLDSDDIWLPERLQRQVDFLTREENRGVAVCGSSCQLINGGGRVFGSKDYPGTHEACRRAFWYRNPLCHSAALIRRECLAEVGDYDEAFNLVQDLELWLRLGWRYRLANLPERLTQVRITGANTSVRQHREMVAATLRARRRAMERYGYRAGMKGHAAMGVTWLVQWLPARWVRYVFNHVLLPRCGFLWEEGGSRERPGAALKLAGLGQPGGSCLGLTTMPRDQEPLRCRRDARTTRFTGSSR